MLGVTYGGNRLYLGRGNMSVFALDTGNASAAPVSVQNPWPDAAGYSDFAQRLLPPPQARRERAAGNAAAADAHFHSAPPSLGPLMLLFEGGGTVYDYGIKIAHVLTDQA